MISSRMVHYSTYRSQHGDEDELVGKGIEEGSPDWMHTLRSPRA